MKAWRILKTNNYKPFKIHISQKLFPGDQERRLNFCRWLQEQIALDPNMLNNIIWSDETKFTNCGVFNRKNQHIWSIENPRENRELRNQIRFCVNVWAGMCGNKILGPYIFNENLNGNLYLAFLNTTFQDYLEEFPLGRLRRLWFQQDGAPPHNTLNVRNFLNEEFPQKWIGNRGAVEWPARSPDLSPLDFFLWGTLKALIYKNPIESREELVANIQEAFLRIRPRWSQRAVNKVQRKIEHCIEVEGNLFEHLERN